MRIVSLNCWGGQLYEPLIKWVRSVQADIYCLQEVGRSLETHDDWLTYRATGRTLAQRANLFRDISRVLPDHQASFNPTARGELFDQQDATVLYEFGLGTFVHNRLPIIGQGLGFVHGQFSADGFGPYPRPQNAHCIRIHDYQTGKSLCLAHLHGLRDESGKGDTKERRHQAERLLTLIAQTRHGDEPLLVCGDLNLLPDSEIFDLLKQIGLSDLVTSRGFTDTRTSHYEKPGRFADYLLVTPNVEIRHFDVVAEPEVSDHRALLIDIA